MWKFEDMIIHYNSNEERKEGRGFKFRPYGKLIVFYTLRLTINDTTKIITNSAS